MKLAIEIDENLYNICKSSNPLDEENMNVALMMHSIANGTPLTESDDAVSREAVINAIYKNGVWENEYNLTSSRIKKAVEELPSVQPKREKGE